MSREQEALAAASEEATLRGLLRAQPALDPLRTMPMPVVQEHTLRESSQPTMERQAVQPATRPIHISDATAPMSRAPITAPAMPDVQPRHAPSATEPNVAVAPASGGRSLALPIIAALVLVALVIGAAWYATRMM